MITNNENKTICSKCDKKCCELMPGSFSPEDIKPLTIKHLVKKFATSEWAIDWWEADPSLYFLRPATKGTEAILDGSWGGECVYLTDTGCKLSFDERPLNCKVLEPCEGEECLLDDKYSKYEFALMWEEHSDLLLEAARQAGVEMLL